MPQLWSAKNVEPLWPTRRFEKIVAKIRRQVSVAKTAPRETARRSEIESPWPDLQGEKRGERSEQSNPAPRLAELPQAQFARSADQAAVGPLRRLSPVKAPNPHLPSRSRPARKLFRCTANKFFTARGGRYTPTEAEFGCLGRMACRGVSSTVSTDGSAPSSSFADA